MSPMNGEARSIATHDGAAQPAEPVPVIITARDGRQLAGLLLSSPTPRAALVINSAAGFPREFYLKFARYAAQRGYHTLVYDYRGIGASAMSPLHKDPARMSDWGVYDIPAAYEWMRGQAPDLPVTTLGHSIGGQFVGMLPAEAASGPHVMIAPSVGYWRWEHAPFRYLALTFWLVYGPLMLRRRGYVPQGRLWTGRSLPRGVFEQWREWCLRPTHFFPELQSELRDHRFGEIRGPLLVCCFEDDPIATRRTVPPLLALYFGARIEQHWISPAEAGVCRLGHGGFFQERHRETLWRLVLDWLDARVGSAERASAIAPSTTAPPTT